MTLDLRKLERECWDYQGNHVDIERFAKIIAQEAIVEVWIQLFNHGIDLSENPFFLEAMKKTRERFGLNNA